MCDLGYTYVHMLLVCRWCIKSYDRYLNERNVAEMFQTKILGKLDVKKS